MQIPKHILPGLVGIGVIVAARLLGLFQPMEWAALDAGLRWRSPESTDDRVMIVGIDEADIQAIGTYPIPDGVLAQLLQKLQTYEPQVIGLDIVRDLPVEPGHGDLVSAFQSMENVIGAESIVPDRTGATIAPPTALQPERIGFVDAVLDTDGNQRRSLLGAATVDGNYQFSMAIRLASAYLRQHGIELTNGIRDETAMRFDSVEFPVIYPNSGGYVGADSGGNQTLLNFRSGPQPFRIVSLTDVLDDQVDPAWFQGRVILIGITANSTKDIAQSSAIVSSTTGLMFGVEVHAHETSQILSAVMEGRSLLHMWSDGWEYSWIIVWGFIGMGSSRLIQRPSRHFLVITITGLGLIISGYVSLLSGWWLPIMPALVAFLLNGVILHAFYLYNRSLQSRISDRQLVIEQTFNAIHNGPLQTLATLMRNLDNPEVSKHTLRNDLQHLNQELRSVYVGIQQEVVQTDRLYLQGQLSLDLTAPLHELLYEVYNDTLQRDFPHFATLKVKVVKFEPFDETSLLSEQKRDLCRFFEEALCNVGKHATAANRLMIDCRYTSKSNIIRVIDNGTGIDRTKMDTPELDTTELDTTELDTTELDGVEIGPPNTNTIMSDAVTSNVISLNTYSPQPSISKGRGTQQAKNLAKQLGGTFKRSPYRSKGTICELKWSPKQPLLHQVQRKIIAVFGRSNGQI